MRGIQGITLLAVTVISISYLFGSMPEASAQVDEFTITKVSDGTETILLDPGGGGTWTAGAISAPDCTGASTGVASDIITTFPGAWDPAGTIPNAVWISSNPAGGEKPPGSDTFLIAVPFSVHPDSFEVTLDFDFLSDNWLGDTVNPNAGLFINCSPLGGSTVVAAGLFKNECVLCQTFYPKYLQSLCLV